ncbi:MAG: hypothetical protein A2X47_00040 [Lentisphaerae bacterium GWF2_38_69]|nr:MAG: hypothetical protein A2X47_00040 [Lentisphaerae bacterium GWF2_38_69]HBG25811.1 hypothetical protein [Phycisphaerales bacterium]
MKRPINVAIIGAGGKRAMAFAEYISQHPEDAKLVAMADSNIEKTKCIKNYFNLDADIYSDIKEIVKRSDVEAVVVCTPDNAHLIPVVEALKSNKNIFIEKPLATTLADCDAMIEAAKNSMAVCYLGFNLRHSPGYEKVHNLITQGKLGKITTIEANEWYYGGKDYFRRWNRFSSLSGGLWLTKACHDFDLITWMAGGKPKSVYAVSSLSHYKSKPNAALRCRDCPLKDTCPDFHDLDKPSNGSLAPLLSKLEYKMQQDGPMAPDLCLFNSEKDTFDNGIAVIQYDNDIRATYTVNVLAAKTTRQMKIIGTEGMVELDIADGIVIFTKRHTNEVIQYDLKKDMLTSHGGADEKIFADFFNLCRNGGTPRSGLDDGRLAVRISLAAGKSDDIDMPVKI